MLQSRNKFQDEQILEKSKHHNFSQKEKESIQQKPIPEPPKIKSLVSKDKADIALVLWQT